MNYDRVIVELLSRVSALEDQVSALNEKMALLQPSKDNGNEGTKPSKRDKTRYFFEGHVYLKNKLVLEVVKKYVADHHGIRFDELRTIFYDGIQGSFGVVRRKNDAKEGRYFLKDEDVIALKDGECVVSNQWGIGNIGHFLVLAESLGYTIDTIYA